MVLSLKVERLSLKQKACGALPTEPAIFKKRFILNNYKRIKDYRQRTKQRLVEIFGGKCQLCGYNKSIAALDFHHLDPSKKDFAIGNTPIHNWEKVLEESKKCILVCANCHREIHAGLLDIKNIELTFSEEKAKYYSNLVRKAKHKELFYCTDCGKEIARPKNSKIEHRCIQCAAKNRRVIERPDRKTLKILVRKNPIKIVGQYFGVTDNTIRKWLKSENLPTKKREIDKYSDEEYLKL